MNIIKISRKLKKAVIISLDIICIFISIIFAYSLRLETFYPAYEINIYVYLIFLSAILGFNFLFGVYEVIARYFNLLNIINLFKSIISSGLILIAINLLIYQNIYFPRSVSFIAIIVIFLLMVIFRVLISFLLNFNLNEKKNALLFGVSKSSLNIINLSKNNESKININSILDLSKEFQTTKINGIKVLNFDSFYKVLEQEDIEYIILDKKFDNINKKNFLIKNLKNTKIRIINIEQSLKLVQGQNYDPLDYLSFQDIINKNKFFINNSILKKNIKNRSIMITGAGGSIGSELANQILNFFPKKIFLLDNSEINLYKIYNQLIFKYPKLSNKIEIVLCDCNHIKILKQKISKNKIDIIFHAAAYKHVWFGEINNYAMLYNNINGLIQMLNFCRYKKAKKFIFISSDKAVNPKSVLGISKKIGEDIVCYFYRFVNKNTNYSIVRFGNVIGSSGSVIPKFINQIKEEKYITLSHKKVKRYFMSIEEAVYLTLYSMSLFKRINIFALDMGSQINIYDIATRLVRLSGKNIKSSSNRRGDIEIKLTGLKKGEKLKEEISLGKNLEKTSHPKIFKCNEYVNYQKLKNKIPKIFEISKLEKKINLKKLFYDFK